MTSRPLAPEIPTQEQCSALTDEQCRKIQELRDPDGVRNYKNWELENQPALIRLYMTMLSFPHIEQAMKTKLDWSYKTYANRFKDWKFPVDRGEREQVVAQVYSQVAASNPQSSPVKSEVSESTTPIRAIQRYPTPPPALPQRSTPFSVPNDFLFPSPRPMEDVNYTYDRMSIDTRMSIETTRTWASSSGASSIFTYNDDTFSNPRSSYAPTISSVGTSQYSFNQSKPPPPTPQIPLPPIPQRVPRHPNSAKHDPFTGIWNNLLRVIPCRDNHSMVMWHDDTYTGCRICGFSRWHALMLNARVIPIELFVTAMAQLRDESRVDFAGNFPIHFLMAAGVGMEYFVRLFQSPNSSAQNVFGQNPLHALDPQHLGEHLINFLDWFKNKENPPGWLLTQRDIYCRTPLHTLFQQPLERSLYRRILETFPFAEHQLRSRDTRGRTCIEMMTDSSHSYRSTNMSAHAKIEAGINEVRLFLSEADLTSSSQNSLQKYGFQEIARGAKGTSYFGFFQCRICDQINAHQNSSLDQLKCACANGRDRNAPDETGMTPVHALITHTRINNDDAQTPETGKQIKHLIEVLIPRGEPTLKEALHVLDPDGNSLVWNVSVKGLDDALAYILDIEDKSRRRAMVNFCRPIGDGRLMCVLEAVVGRLRDVRNELRMTQSTKNIVLKRILVEKGNTLLRVRKILVHHGAIVTPCVTTRFRIV